MIQALPSECWHRKTDLKALLLEDPGLLQDEIWRIFVTRAADRPDSDTCPRPGIHDPGLELAREGRSRALGCSMRPWTVSSVTSTSSGRDGSRPCTNSWIPTIEERSDRSSRYLALLASRNPSTVGFALKALKALDKAEQLDPAALAARIVPALHVRAKGSVKLALQLLDSAARRGPDALSTGRAAAIAVEALVHESPEIQEMALDLIERHGDPSGPELRPALVERAESLAPSQRNRLEAWLRTTPAPSAAPAEIDALIERADRLESRWARIAGVPEALAAVRHGGDLTALTWDGTEIPRLDPARGARADSGSGRADRPDRRLDRGSEFARRL